MKLLIYFMWFHFLVDGLCGASLLGPMVSRLPDYDFELVLLYNILAFPTQFATGILADWLKRDRVLTWLSLLMVLVGSILTLCPIIGVLLFGLGNSLFHVSAGREVIRKSALTSNSRALELGLFVGPGALGIGLGAMFPDVLHPYFQLAVIFSLWMFGINAPERTEEAINNQTTSRSFDWSRLLATFLIVFCVCCRAAAGSCRVFPIGNSAWVSIGLLVLVMTGKMAGGAISDRVGLWRTGSVALVLSWALFAIGEQSLLCILGGQFIANLLMAVTLCVLVRLYPRHPGLMFGIAASVLLPGNMIQFIEGSSQLFSILYLLAIVSFVLAGVLDRKNRMLDV